MLQLLLSYCYCCCCYYNDDDDNEDHDHHHHHHHHHDHEDYYYYCCYCYCYYCYCYHHLAFQLPDLETPLGCCHHLLAIPWRQHCTGLASAGDLRMIMLSLTCQVSDRNTTTATTTTRSTITSTTTCIWHRSENSKNQVYTGFSAPKAHARAAHWAPFNFDQCPIPFAWRLFGNPPKFPARKISSRILDVHFFRLEVLDYQGYKVGICVTCEVQGDFRDRGCNHNKEQPPHTYIRIHVCV